MTYLFLSEGAAGISAGGVQLGAGLSPSQQLLGTCIISLAIILVNIVFNVIAFRENGRISRRSYCKESERQHLEMTPLKDTIC